MGSQKISVLDEQTSGTKPADSFVVDMERFSNNLLEKDLAANSRIKRSLSRKGSVRSSERKPNPNENPIIATSPRAAPLHGASTPEKLTVVTMGATDNSAPQPHNQITIMAGGATPAESKLGGRRFSFRRPSSPSWTIDPRRILLFFATLILDSFSQPPLCVDTVDSFCKSGGGRQVQKGEEWKRIMESGVGRN